MFFILPLTTSLSSSISLISFSLSVMTMKIFNWMPWKMQPRTVYSRVSSHKQPPDVFMDGKEMETDQEALLLHNVLDGILTIGTLGLQDIHHSPLPPDDHEYGNAKEEEEEEDHEHSQEVLEEVEMKVAMVPLTVSKSLRSSFREKDNEKQNMEVVVKVVAEQDQHCHRELMVEPLLKEDKERSEKGRTTLADLFAASDASPRKGKSTSPPKERIDEEPTKEYKKNNNRNSKKNEDNPMVEAKTTIKATKKMKRLITRMLKKKKVHPEMVVSGLIETASLMSKEMEKISLINQDIGQRTMEGSRC